MMMRLHYSNSTNSNQKNPNRFRIAHAIKNIGTAIFATFFLANTAHAAETTRPRTNSDIAISGDGNNRSQLVIGGEYFRYRDSVPILAGDSNQHTDQHTVSASLALRVANPLFIIGRYAYTNAELDLNLASGPYSGAYTTAVDRKDSILAGLKLVLDTNAGAFFIQALGGVIIPRDYRTEVIGMPPIVNNAPVDFDGMLEGVYLSPAQKFAIFTTVLRNAFDPFIFSLQDRHLPSLVNGVPTVVEANATSHRIYLQQTDDGVTEHPNGRRYLGSLDLFVPAFGSDELYAGLDGGVGYDIICPLNECGNEEIHRFMANGGAFFDLGSIQISIDYNHHGKDNMLVLTVGTYAESKKLFFGGRYIRPLNDARTEHAVVRAGINEETEESSRDGTDSGGGGDLGGSSPDGKDKRDTKGTEITPPEAGQEDEVQAPPDAGSQPDPINAGRTVEVTDLPAELQGKNQREIGRILNVLEYDFNNLTYVPWQKVINDLVNTGYLDTNKINISTGPKNRRMKKAVEDLQRTINEYLGTRNLLYYYRGENTTTPLDDDGQIGGRTAAATSAFLKFAINEIRAAYQMELFE